MLTNVMNKNVKNGLLASVMLVTIATTNGAFAQQNTMAGGSSTMVGKESKAEFDRQNKKGAAAVAAVKATSAKLSDADSKLMMQVAMGGMMQLEVSKVAVQKATNPAVRELAQAEVEEQTGLSAKLKEITTAKGAMLPMTPDADTQAMVSKMQGMSGADFDKMYVQESGVKGHQKLDQVMSTVESSASDSSLKDLAKAAHPLVKTHLKVSQAMMSSM